MSDPQNNPAPADPVKVADPANPAPKDPPADQANPNPNPAGDPPAGDPPADPAKVVDPNAPPKDDGTKPSDDWRVKMATGKDGKIDEKFLKELGRVDSPETLAQNYKELRRKISAGELISKVDAPTDPEALKEWRKENDVPETPEAYDTTLSEGLVIGEADKPYVDSFLKGAHESNIPQKYVKATLDHYFKMQEDAIAAEIAQDKIYQSEAEETLRSDFGPEYKANMNAMGAFLEQSFGQEGYQNIMKARLLDGTILGDNPEVIKTFVRMAREANPAATILPNSANPTQSAETELANLEAEMATPAWNDKKSARHTELVSYLQKQGKKV